MRFIGMENLILNALIISMEVYNTRVVPANKVMNYAQHVVEELESSTGEQCILVADAHKIDIALSSNYDYITIEETEVNHNYIVRDGVTLEQMKERGRYCLSYDFLKACVKKEFTCLLGE